MYSYSSVLCNSLAVPSKASISPVEPLCRKQYFVKYYKQYFGNHRAIMRKDSILLLISESLKSEKGSDVLDRVSFLKGVSVFLLFAGPGPQRQISVHLFRKLNLSHQSFWKTVHRIRQSCENIHYTTPKEHIRQKLIHNFTKYTIL